MRTEGRRPRQTKWLIAPAGVRSSFSPFALLRSQHREAAILHVPQLYVLMNLIATSIPLP